MEKITTTIHINGLRLFARHGVMPQEKVVGNEFEINVLLNIRADEAIENDDISATVNYAVVVDIIKQQMEQPSRLLENVAGRIRKALVEEFPQIESGEVTVAKLAPPIAEQMNYVAVTIKW